MKEKDKERMDLNAQQERQKKLRKLGKAISKTQAHPMGSGLSRSYPGFSRLSRIERLMERWLGDDFFRYRLGWDMPPWYEPSDSDSEATDSSEDETGNTVTQNFIRLLKRQVCNAQMLETNIQKLQDHRDRIESVANLKQILDVERGLEDEWPKQLGDLKGHQLSTSDGDSTAQPNDHLSGRRTPNAEFYKTLSRGEFRVLVLIPAPEPYHPLVCKLEAWSMEDAADTGIGAQSH
ncbi:hypothetical protein NM208_g5199 [Fusarium decemcellulare]|uniref:Uncharacterized protein n=1 Tax=Fusarium decemcellulare TaxID=57161 RepID=A0ACC1SI48_9HYPO|nr:hypothetical protein NM208_g5199 [Fusarium decemcellulare]